MSNISDANPTVSLTIADTLSESQKRELLHGAEQDYNKRGSANYKNSSPYTDSGSASGRDSRLNLIQHIKTYPLQSAGIAILGSVLVRAIFGGKR